MFVLSSPFLRIGEIGGVQGVERILTSHYVLCYVVNDQVQQLVEPLEDASH